MIDIEEIKRLLESRFQPLPLTDNSLNQIPNVADLLTYKEIEEAKKEDPFGEVHPVNYIRDHEDFWIKLPDRLEKEAWRFNNVGTVMGKHTLDGMVMYRHELDIDSEEVYNRLKKFIEDAKDKTVVVKTRKPYGCRVYWFEQTRHRNIATLHCKPDHEFEIKCESGYSTLPPSCHRDDESFHYSFYGNVEKIAFNDGRYDKLLKILEDCLNESWNTNNEGSHSEGPTKPTYNDLTPEQIRESVNKLQFLYIKGFRNPFVYAFSGLAFNNGISLNSCLEIIKQLATECHDEELRSRIAVVKNTYHNGEMGKSINGYSGLVQVITSAKKYMNERSAGEYIEDFIKEVWNIGQTSTNKDQSNKDGKAAKPKKVSKCFKYSDNGRINLHESIIIDRLPKFVTYNPIDDKVKIKDSIEEATRVISPYEFDEYPNMPYEFENEEQLNEYIEKARVLTKDSLFNKIQNVVTKYVDQDTSMIDQITIDIQVSYLQDQFPTIHYDCIVGSNEVGKSVIGFMFEGLAYRPVKGTGMSAPNYYRLLGSVEPGQCTIIEDEADHIDEDIEKMKIFKTGYEYNAKIPKINMNTKEQGQQWFYTYNFKLLLAENAPRIHKARGVLDRTFMMYPRPGVPKEPISIKDVLTAGSRIGNSKEYSKELDLYYEINDLRKLLFCYRLVNHHKLLPDIESGLKGRNAELANPTLRYFFGCECIEQVKESLSHFLNQRKQRNTNTTEAAIYPIINKFVSNGDLLVPFKSIWDAIRTEIPGVSGNEKDNHPQYQNESNEVYEKRLERYNHDYTKHVTEDYGVFYYNTISELVMDKFGSEKKKSNKGLVIRFDKNKIAQFESRYGTAEDIKIELKLRSKSDSKGDGSDAGDGNGEGAGNREAGKLDGGDGINSTNSKMTTTHPLILASPASPASLNGEQEATELVTDIKQIINYFINRYYRILSTNISKNQSVPVKEVKDLFEGYFLKKYGKSNNAKYSEIFDMELKTKQHESCYFGLQRKYQLNEEGKPMIDEFIESNIDWHDKTPVPKIL